MLIAAESSVFTNRKNPIRIAREFIALVDCAVFCLWTCHYESRQLRTMFGDVCTRAHVRAKSWCKLIRQAIIFLLSFLLW